MESSAPTQELEPASRPTSKDVGIAEGHPSVVVSTRDQCSACAAAMAPDQRYCVECGQRRGPARVPLMEGLAQRTGEAPASRRAQRRGHVSVDSTLIAGIGTLLLAMGIGVLIGRSGNSTSTKTPPAQVVTVSGGGGAASTGTAATSATTSTPAAGSTTTAAKSKKAGGAPGAPSTSKKAAIPPPKTVTVGSPGHGPGYQNGHFTGNFFGP